MSAAATTTMMAPPASAAAVGRGRPAAAFIAGRARAGGLRANAEVMECIMVRTMELCHTCPALPHCRLRSTHTVRVCTTAGAAPSTLGQGGHRLDPELVFLAVPATAMASS